MSNFKNIRSIPISVLEVIKTFKEKDGSLFEQIPYESGYIQFQGTGKNESLYLKIDSHELKGGEISVLVTVKPSSVNIPSESKRWVNVKNFDTAFSNWCELLKKYNELSDVFEDQDRLNNIADQFFSEFEFTNDEEDKFFTVPELVKIDTTIEQLENWIEDNQQQFLPVLYDQIKREISDTKEGLTENSKGWIAKKIAKIQALIMKQGPRLLKETAVEVLKATVAEVIKTKLIG